MGRRIRPAIGAAYGPPATPYSNGTPAGNFGSSLGEGIRATANGPSGANTGAAIGGAIGNAIGAVTPRSRVPHRPLIQRRARNRCRLPHPLIVRPYGELRFGGTSTGSQSSRRFPRREGCFSAEHFLLIIAKLNGSFLPRLAAR